MTTRGWKSGSLAAAWLAAVACGNSEGTRPPTAAGGVLDLSQWDLQNRAVRLDGEWAFYWRQLLEPADFAGAPPAGRSLAAVPGPWSRPRAGWPHRPRRQRPTAGPR